MKVIQSCLICDSPWNFPGHNTGVGSFSLLQGIFPTQGSNPGLQHWRWILYQLSHKGNPSEKPAIPPPSSSNKGLFPHLGVRGQWMGEVLPHSPTHSTVMSEESCKNRRFKEDAEIHNIISKMSGIYVKITQYQEPEKFWIRKGNQSDTDTEMTDVGIIWQRF